MKQVRSILCQKKSSSTFKSKKKAHGRELSTKSKGKVTIFLDKILKFI